MLKNYLTVAFRNLLRQRVYSAINIGGLAIGMACCILIVQYIRFELSYDGFHGKADRIYRVVRETRSSGGSSSFGMGTSGNLGPALRESYPEIEKVARAWFWGGWMMFEGEGRYQTIVRIDNSYLDIFDFPFAKGSAETAFTLPNSMVITEETAIEYFGDDDPMGKVVSFDARSFSPSYTITGVLKDIPRNSTIRFNGLITAISGEEPLETWNQWAATYSWRPIQTWITLPADHDPKDLESKLPALMEQHMGAEIREKNTYHLQPLTRIYLHSKSDYNLDWYGDINQIYTFGLVAVSILLIACVNFMNLATARSVRRAREVGLRKVVGARRAQLIGQFLGESVLLALLALPLGFCLAQLALPAFSGYTGSYISSGYDLVPGMVVFAVFVGFLAGSYPALYLSAYRPVAVLDGGIGSGARGVWFRKALVIFQFGASIVLIIGTVVVFDQLTYLRSKDLGFNKEHMIVVPIFLSDRETTKDLSRRLSHRHQVVKNAFLRHSGITEATALRYLPGEWGGMVRVVSPEGSEGSEWRMHESDWDFDPILRGKG